MNYTYDITLDMNLSNDLPVVRVKEGDGFTRFIRAKLTTNDEPYIPDNDITIMFRCEKPDGKAVVTDSAHPDPQTGRFLVENNGDGTVTIELIDQVAVVIGKCKCDLCLMRGGEIISTLPFVIMVIPAPNIGERIASTDAFRIFVSRIEMADNLMQGIAQSVGRLVISANWNGDASPYHQYVSVSGYNVTAATKVDLLADAETVSAMLQDSVNEIMIVNENGMLKAVSVGGYPQQPLAFQVCMYETNVIEQGGGICGQPVVAAVSGGGGGAVIENVDDAFNAESANPVQNKVITEWVNEPTLTLVQDEETKLVYVATQNGVRLGDGLYLTGGGGGGSTYVPKLRNLLDSRTISVAKGGAAVIAFNYSSVDSDGENDGEGTGIITFNSLRSQTLRIQQGDTSMDISEYLSDGENTVLIQVTNSAGVSTRLQYTVYVIVLSITTTFTEMARYSGDVTYVYTVTGTGEKTIHFIMDGTEIGRVTTEVTGRSQSYLIQEQIYGGHVFECYAEMNLNGVKLESNHLRHGMIWLQDGMQQAAIVSTFNQKTAVQGEILRIPYMAYDPLQATALVNLIVLDEDGNQYSADAITVDRSQQNWNLDDYPAGNIILRLRCGVATVDFPVAVEAFKLPVDPVTDGLALEFSAAGRSNGEVNPASWSYGDISATFTNFGWRNADGWLSDEDGATVLRFLPGDTMEIPFYSFQNNITANGYTIEVEMATHNVRDYDSVVISCMSDGHGFLIRSQSAELSSEQSGVSVLFKEDTRVRVAFSIESLNLNRLIYIYVNGIMCGVAQYPASDNFRQVTPKDILIGAESCGLDLYKIRIYNKGLSSTEQLDNFIVDRSTLAERRAAYERNDILDENENVTINRLPKWLSHILIKGPRLPASKEEDDATVEIEFVDPQNPARSWRAVGVKLGIQGTSSAGYPIKNWKFKLKKGIEYIEKDADGNVRTDVGFPIHEGEIPTQTICWKADFASSENANNVVLAMYYNDLCPYKTPAQIDNPKVRQGIDGFSSTLFWLDTSTNEVHFLGKGNCNVDKGNGDVFGLTKDYPNAESWEFLNNTSSRTLFSGADFDAMGVDDDGNPIKAWQNDFEARYPKDSLAIDKWAEAVRWVASTDTNAVSTEAEKTARLQKFRNEFEDHFLLEPMLFFYIFTEAFLIMDNRAKNMFMTTYDGVHWFTLPYDFDSALGINNEGSLTFGYWLEDTDLVDGAEVYTGQKSVLWNNFRVAYADEIRETYRTLRSMSDGDPSKQSPFSYYRAAKRFTDHQEVWPEALWNEDAYTKYLVPYFTTGEDYLDRLLGSKASQRDWWLFNRFGYLDSKYFCGDAATNRIVLRTYRVANISITPYSDIYGRVRYGSYDTVKRCKRNVTYVMECGADNLNDTETYIYSADRLRSVGDLSPLMVGEWNSAVATKLQEIKLGDSDPNYNNPYLGAKNSVNVGTNDLLTSIDVTNCSGFGTGQQKTLDVSGCPSLREVLASGTALSGVQLPNGGHLKTLKLPRTISNFTIQNQPEVTTLSFDGYGSLTTLVVENTPNIPIETLILNNPVSNFRLINFEFTTTAANLQLIYNKLSDESTRGIEADLQTETTVGDSVSGIINVNETVPDELIAAFGALCPEVLIVVNGQATCVVRFRDWDGTILNVQNIARGTAAIDPVEAELIETPVRPNTERIKYTYAGWDHDLTNIQTHTVITAVYNEERGWFAIFQNWDGTELYRELVMTGEAVEDPVKTKKIDPPPTRPADETHSYVYLGWDMPLVNFRADRIITATYATNTALTVIFNNYLGEELYRDYCMYGGTVPDPLTTGAITREDVARPDDEEKQVHYVYVGWNRDLSNVLDNLVVTPTYSRLSYYKATFKNYDGTELYVEKLNYRSAVYDPVEKGELKPEPTRPPEDTYNYIYKGWDKELATSITENLEYTAQYKTDQVFTVKFVNYDNDQDRPLNTQYVMDEDSAVDPVVYGIIATPTRPPDDQYQYTYNGWNTSLTNIKADRVIMATYQSSIRMYNIRFLNADGTVVRDDGEVGYGTKLVKPDPPAHPSGDPKYEFLFWDPDETTVTKDRDYLAVFRDNTIELVRYLDGSMTEYRDSGGGNIADYAFYVEPNLEEVTANPARVGRYAFYNCPKLKEVDLTGEGALSLLEYAFSEDKKLTDLILRGSSVAAITYVNNSYAGYTVMSSTPIAAGLGTVYVPDDLVANYKSASNWGAYRNRIYPISAYPITNYETISDSWDDIVAAENDGSYLSKYKVGDTKLFKVNGSDVYAQIAGIDQDDKADGSGKAHISWLVLHPYATARRMDNFSHFASFNWEENDGIWTPLNKGYHNSAAECTWTVNVRTAGTFVIEYRCSSEGADPLTIQVNGTQVVRSGGVYSWRSYSMDCAAGDTITVLGRYDKDVSVHTGEDSAFIRFSGTATVNITPSYIDPETHTYNNSELYTWLQNTLTPQIESAVREKIVPVTKKSFHAYVNRVRTTTESVWIPSSYELGGTHEGSGARYTELMPNAYSRLRCLKSNYANVSYWTRTIMNGGYIYCSSSSGTLGTTYPNSNSYVLYGFCT